MVQTTVIDSASLAGISASNFAKHFWSCFWSLSQW